MLRLTLALLIASLAQVPAQVSINEIAAAPNERLLRYDAAGQPRLGTGAAWFDPLFNATAWAVAQAPMGHNFTGLATDLSAGLFARTPSLYLRKTFTLNALNAGTAENLRLKVDFNDGFIAFLNGKEVARARMGAVKMFAYADSLAFSSRPSTGVEIFDLGPANALLQAGENVLAIHVSNNDIEAKGNLRFDASLELNNGINTTTEYSQTFNDANDSLTTHTNNNGTPGNSSSGTIPSGSWLADSPPVESSGPWTSLAIISKLDATAGYQGTGGIKYTFTGTGAVQTATVRGPGISLANKWAASAVTLAELNQTTVSFRYKTSSPLMGVDFALEPTGGPTGVALDFGRLPPQGNGPTGDTVGFWRFDEASAANGATMTTAVSQTNGPTLNATPSNGPKFSTDIPGTRITDPLSGTHYVNTFSMDVTAANARVSAPNNTLLNTTSFTVECFIKITGEPVAIDDFIQRFVSGSGDSSASSSRHGWQLNFNSGTTATTFGKSRMRWDLPGVPPSDFNRTLTSSYLYVDTPSGDGDPNNYTAVADVQTVGNGSNDASTNVWHHLAFTYNNANRVVTLYTDYANAVTLTLNAPFTHPGAVMNIGKLTNAIYELRMDEVRYSNRVLAPSEMLRASNFDPNAYTTYTAKFSQTTPASQSAFVAALNGVSGTSFRPVFKVRADSYDAAGRSLTLDDFNISYSVTAPIVPFIQLGETYAYKIGYGEPSGGVLEPNLPPVPNNPSEANDPAAFPDLPSFSDWVELKNTGSTEVNLTGWFLSDDAGKPTKWAFPAGASIPANGYLLVLCDENSAVPGLAYLHTNFKLSEGGEKILLSNGNTLVDLVDYPRQNPFVTYGRTNPGAVWGYFNVATPGAENPTTRTATVRCQTPDFFSDLAGVTPAVGGFFTGAQTLVMRTFPTDAEIRYTTNGSEPTESSTLYTSPLTVTPAANDKTGRIIRARAFKLGTIASGTKSITYLINQNAALKTVPALCFTADAGQAFYAPYGVATIVGGVYDLDGIWSASGNADYNMAYYHGRPYERPVFVEWLRNDGLAGFAEEAGIRVAASPHSRPRMKFQQNAASPWPASSVQKPSFNVFFREDYDKPSLDYPLLGQDYPVNSFDQIRPRAGKNDILNPFIKDELVRRMFRAMGRKSVQGVINTLYVNGIYKGIYNTVERYRDNFFDEHYGVSADWDIRINDTVEEGDAVAWTTLLTALQQDLTVQANFNSLTAQIDLEEMIDYYLLNIYCGTWDWPNNNWVAARQRSTDGRWRFYVWDAEGSFGHSGNKPPNYDTILVDLKTNAGTGISGMSQIFRSLYSSPEVKLRFADRINHWFFNGQILDDRNPGTSRIAALKGELTATFGPLLAYSYAVSYNDAFWTNWTTSTTANANDGIWTTAMSNRRSHLFNTSPIPASNISFRSHGLCPSTEPVTFSQHGGNISAGFALTMNTNATVPVGSTIYYTLDGSDPRTWNGGVAAGALTYATAMPLPAPFARVSARVRNINNGEWSAGTTADFLTDSQPANANNLVVSQIHYHTLNPTLTEVNAGITSDDNFEFIELMAIGSTAVALSQVQIISGVTFDFAATGAARVLLPGQRVLLVKNLSAFQLRYGHAYSAAIAGTYLGTLSNSGETIWITGADGPDADTTRDDIKKFTYADSAPWPEAPDGHGPSLVLMRPASNPDHANGLHWRSSAYLHGTPLASDAQGYETWAGAQGINDLLGTEDTDHDGLANLLEYFLDSDPTNPSLAALPTVTTATLALLGNTEDFLTLTFTRALGRDDVTFEVQTSTDPANAQSWSPAIFVSAEYLPSGRETLVYRCPDSIIGHPKQFLRVRLSRP